MKEGLSEVRGISEAIEIMPGKPVSLLYRSIIRVRYLSVLIAEIKTLAQFITKPKTYNQLIICMESLGKSP